MLLCARVFAQVPPDGPKFEVASVKPVRDWPPASSATRERGSGGGCPTSLKTDPGRIEIRCANLAMLIGYAYRFSPDRITGPDWMRGIGSPRFDIAATLPRGLSTKQVPEMMQSLLAERFHLEIHRGTADRAIYALVVAKGGLKMKTAAPGVGSAATVDAAPATGEFYGSIETRTVEDPDGSGSFTISSPRMGKVRQTGDGYRLHFEAPEISMAGLADLIDKEAPLPSAVIDRTGLEGRYQMVLEVDLTSARPANAAAGSDPVADLEANALKSFNDGLQKLGLHLERGKGLIETIVVDHVEKTPIEN